MSVFKKHVLESFDDDELPPELARERSAVSGVEQVGYGALSLVIIVNVEQRIK